MSVHELLCKRAEQGKPIRVGMIGAGRYGAMYLGQSLFIPGIQIVCVADLDLEKAKKALLTAGYPEGSIVAAKSAGEINDAARNKKVAITTDSNQLIQSELDVMIEITGTVEAATHHAWCAMDAGKHVVMVSTEADALVGLALQRKAEEKKVVYSFGYGDEPAELCEMIDWARSSGFQVACVGKYIEYTPEKRHCNPSNVWSFKPSFTKELTDTLNAKLFSSFVDGTKTLTECCCAANASGLVPPWGGMKFPPLEYDDMANKLIPKSDGGLLDSLDTVEVPSNYYHDGRPVTKHLRWGVFITFRAYSDYVAGVLAEFRDEKRVIVSSTGRYGLMYRPTHILGLELNKSVSSVALFGLPTGAPKGFTADMVAVAKKDLVPGESLDGPGAYTTYGQLVPARESLQNRYLPTGFSERVKVIRPVAKDTILTYNDVEIDQTLFSYKLRKQIEAGKA
jgi:predicted homoserine dehydrogenase-like protein